MSAFIFKSSLYLSFVFIYVLSELNYREGLKLTPFSDFISYNLLNFWNSKFRFSPLLKLFYLSSLYSYKLDLTADATSLVYTSIASKSW